VVEGERPLPPLRLPSRSEEDDEDDDSLRRLRAFFDFFAFFFGTFDLDLAERDDALLAGIADLSFSLATPSDSESDEEREPTLAMATAAAADAPEADGAAAAAAEVLGLITTPSASYWIRGTSSSVGPSDASSVAVASCSCALRRLSLSLFVSFGAMVPEIVTKDGSNVEKVDVELTRYKLQVRKQTPCYHSRSHC
jgi:hypothetical protein